MMPKELKKDSYKEALMSIEQPVILEIYLPTCGVCQQMEPIIAEVEKELGPNYVFAKANAYEIAEIAKEYSIQAVPTFLFIRKYQVQDSHKGYIAKDDLIQKIKEIFK